MSFSTQRKCIPVLRGMPASHWPDLKNKEKDKEGTHSRLYQCTEISREAASLGDQAQLVCASQVES